MQDVSNDSAQSHLLFNNNPATSQVSAIDFSELSSAFNTVLQVKGCPVALLDINGNVLACSDWPVTPSGLKPLAQFIAKNSDTLCVTPITLIDEQVGSLFVGHYQGQNDVAANTLPDTIMHLLAPLTFHAYSSHQIAFMQDAGFTTEFAVLLVSATGFTFLVSAQSMSKNRPRGRSVLV